MEPRDITVDLRDDVLWSSDRQAPVFDPTKHWDNTFSSDDSPILDYLRSFKANINIVTDGYKFFVSNVKEFQDGEEYIEIFITNDKAPSTRKPFQVGSHWLNSMLIGDTIIVRLKRDELQKIRHNFCCFTAFGSLTGDVKPTDIFPTFAGTQAGRTPDFILNTFGRSNMICIMDVTTTDQSVRKINNAFKSKMTYKILASEFDNEIRQGRPTEAYALIVTSSEVHANGPVNQGMVNELIVAYNVAEQLEDFLLTEGFSIPKDTDYTERQSEMNSMVSSIQTKCVSYMMDYESFPDISMGIINKFWSMSEDSEYTKQVVEKYLADSINELETLRAKPVEETIKERIEKYNEDRKAIVKVTGEMNLGDKKKSVGVLPVFNLKNIVRNQMPKVEAKKAYGSFVKPLEKFFISYAELLGDENHLTKWWKGAFLSAANTHVSGFFEKEEPNHKPVETNTWQKKFNSDRNKRNRVNVALSKEDKHQLAKDGINGKEYSNEPFMRDRKALKKRLINAEEDVTDITKCIEGGFFDFLMKEGDDLWDQSTCLSYKSLDKILSEHLGSNELKMTDAFITSLRKTRFGDYTYVMHRIVEELNFSLSQSCTRNKFILKQIDDLPVFLLIKPTRVDSHIFFSIMIDKTRCEFENYGLPFRSVAYEDDNIAIFDPVSLHRHKISHYYGMFWRMIPFLSNWMDLLSIPQTDVQYLSERENFASYKELICTTTFSWLVFMDATGKVSADLQQLRYAYMDACSVSILPKDPLKCLEKFSKVVRNRLQFWVHERSKVVFSEMMKVRPIPAGITMSGESPEETKQTDELREEEGEESIEKDYKAESPDALSQEETIFERDLLNKANTSLKYRNLLSFTSMSDVSSFEYVLNLSYIGYIHNKDEVVNQANFQILRKILSEEIKLRNNTPEDLEDIWSDKIRDKYENHLYSAKMTVNVSAAIARHLSRKLGTQWKKKIRREMFDSVGRKTLEDYATLKASAVRPQNPKVEKGNDLSDLEERVQNSSGSRRKCLEAILEVSKDLNLNVNPFKSMSKLMTVAIKDGGTYAALFKKNQIGGEREIFILTIIDRLLINFLETISRVVCGYLDCEMMTKPSVKATKSTRHFSAIAESLKSKSQDVVTAIDSGDCTTWAQRFVMEVFLGMYKEIVDFDLFVVIGAILKLHANKRLELPAELAYYFLKNPDIMSTDKGMEELKSQFAGQSKNNDLVEPLSRLLKNRSNMEQGILHFTSSMLHAGFKCLMQEVNDKLVDQFLSKIFTKEGSFRFVRDDKVSSDDMSTIRTIAIDWSFYSKKEIKDLTIAMSKKMGAELPNLRDKIKSMCAIYTAVLTLLESRMMNMLTIKESNEKSTRNVLNKIEEFNSVWLVMDTVMCPKVKFLYPATFTSPISNFYNRTSTAFDQRKQMVENGCSLLTASITGECQRALHYMSLGSTSRQDRHLDVLRSLEEKPCISNGYFPQEPERMCGLLGLDFIHYLLCSRVEKYSKVESQNFSKDDIELNEHGLSTVKTFLLLGQARKYYETLDRILGNNSLETAKLTLESNPICYFRQSENAKESRAKIIMKIIQPSCVDAFSYLGPNKLYASAAYSLTQPVVSRRFYNDDGTVNRTKQSLIGILRDQSIGDPLTEEQLSVLFPNRSFYEDVLVMYTGEINTMIPTLGASRLFNKYITIELPKSIARAPLSLSYCCRRIWFRDVFPKKYPDSLLRESWSVYQSIFKWLKDDLSETLESSTFSTYRSLYQFISSMEPSSRSFKALTRGNREEGILATLKSIIRMSFIHYGRLSKGDDPVVFRSLESNMTKLKKEITKLVDTPLTWSTKMLLTKRIILDSADSLSLIDLVTNSTIFHTPRGIQDICIIALYLQWREGNSPKVYYTQNNISQKLPFGNWYSKMRGAPKAIFLVRQTLDNQTLKWKGEGLISLTIDNSVYEVKIIDSKILKVSCESVIKFESDKIIITDILRDLTLEPSQAIMNGAKIYCTMQGEISSSKIGSFAVMEVKGINEKQPVSYYNSQYFIEYSEDSIKLMQQVPRSNNQRESMNPAFTVARVRFDQLKVRRETQWDETDRVINFNDPSSTSNLRDYLITKYASDYESLAQSILHTERMEGRKLSGLIRDMEILSSCNVDPEVKNELSNMAVNFSRMISEDKFSRFNETSWQYELGQILKSEGEESIIAMVHGLLDEISSESIRMRKKMREWFISRVMVKDYNKRYFTITSASSLKLRSMLMKEKIFDNKSASSISSIASSFRGDDVTTETVVKPAVEKAGLFDLEFDFDFIESQLSDLNIDNQQSNLESMAFNFDDVLVTQALSIIFDMEDKKVFEEKERISLTGLKSHLPWCDNFIEALLSSTHYKIFEILLNEFLWNSSPLADQLKDLVKELVDETHSEAIVNGLIKTLYKLTMADTREMKFSKIVDTIISDKRKEKEARKNLLSEFSE